MGQKALEKVNHALLYILWMLRHYVVFADMRLALYEDMYGYTYIRFLVHAFMILLALAFNHCGVQNPLPSYCAYQMLYRHWTAAYVLINYIGMDRIIAGNNIERFRETGKIDAGYLADLSARCSDAY